MRTASVVLALALGLVAACGDNLRVGTNPDATDTWTDGPAGDADPNARCGDGVVTGTEQCEDSVDNACCSGCMFVAFEVECRGAASACDVAEVCDGLSPTCPADAMAPDGAACVGGFCANGTCTNCNAAVDADFDGSNQCLDCNDTNGLVFPAAQEKACDGLDDDCDGTVDEDYDLDVDGYSVCSDDPLVRDCDDMLATVHPGAPELCGVGPGNGRDDNCNGYIDETCTNCDTVDNDGDGASECQGDCNDAQATVGPGKPEACDGFDTDCNTFTTENCDVSDACNFVGGADECMENLECGCVVGTSGQCTGDYRCSSFCEGSFTGPIGAGCTATQTCLYRWTLSDNQHACVETTATLGTKLGGEICTQSTECRSGNCDNYCVGPGCNVKRCVDYCDHHEPGGAGSCATGAVCEIVSSSLVANLYMYATCQLADNGTRVTGESCTGGCTWGAQSCVNNVCAQPCGDDAQCPDAYHCSLAGNQVVAGTWGVGSPLGVTGQPAIETVPVCLADTGAGMHDRPGGSACSQHGDCESQYCERTQHVCIDPCVSDASCAIGLTCEPRYVRATAGVGMGVVWGRVCANDAVGAFLEPL